MPVGNPESGTPVRLSAIRHETFGVSEPYPALAGLAGMYAERFASYRTPIDPDRPPAGNRNNFARMGAEVIARLCGSVNPDAVVLAHTVPDGDPRISVAGYLQQRLGGQPLVLAISDQGRLAPFTALRIAADYVRRGDRDRVAIIAVDQGTLMYDDPAFAELDRAADHAVGLLVTRAGPARVAGPSQLPQTAASQVAGAVAAALDEFQVTGPVSVVAGTALDPRGQLPGRELWIRRAPRGQLCTAVWSVVADELSREPGQARVVLAVEYEPALELLCLAAFDTRPIADDRDC